ncbi:ricin-type beta-trefoil lectin domain protein [Solwaraspora sp. WMMD791]|uniref:RICIN domain-containing protein n=1 Tax=Solwaraspora sp. WMMD791 TaxID=3016086 RepID=UPI00249AC71B|nr:ricin-type beta-trefoil lectin domain protein [Solwaraspora sp. WMMD791]WFE27703.1 ricin-type beta-trefoil lectin domain protein [Solwaraspora sp. WMMD791]
MSKTFTRWGILALSIITALVAGNTPARASSQGDHLAPQAQAAPFSYISQPQSSRRCLDGSVSQGVRLNVCSGGSTYQRWSITSQQLRHVQSGRCLDGSVSQGIRLITCNGSTYQRWSITSQQLRHVQSGRCLDGSVSQGIRLITCNGSLYQQWQVTTVTPLTASPGWTAAKRLGPVFVPKIHSQSGRCLDYSASQGLRLNTCNGSTYQGWGITLELQHEQTRRCLDYSVSQGLRVITCNGSVYQRWDRGSTNSPVRHVQSGRCLDGSISQGVRVMDCNGSLYQAWTSV